MSFHVDHVDLPLAQLRRIDCVLAQIHELNYYELLGVEPDASRQAIGQAYLERALEFQSTRYVARRLGSYRTRMDIIFAKVTEAHATLVSPDRRAEYDRELRRARLEAVEEMTALEMASEDCSESASRREVIDVRGVRLEERFAEALENAPRRESGEHARITLRGLGAVGRTGTDD